MELNRGVAVASVFECCTTTSQLSDVTMATSMAVPKPVPVPAPVPGDDDDEDDDDDELALDDDEFDEEDEPVRRLRSSSLRPVVGWRMPHCKICNKK